MSIAAPKRREARQLEADALLTTAAAGAVILLVVAFSWRWGDLQAAMESTADLAAPLALVEQAHAYPDAYVMTGNYGWWPGLGIVRVQAGELVGVWGPRRSGRTTLALVAAGIVRPTAGVARFAGEALHQVEALGKRGGIGVGDREFDPVMAATVLEHVAAPLLSGSISNREAERVARAQLERVGADDLAGLDPADLDSAESMRVAMARATRGSRCC